MPIARSRSATGQTRSPFRLTSTMAMSNPPCSTRASASETVSQVPATAWPRESRKSSSIIEMSDSSSTISTVCLAVTYEALKARAARAKPFIWPVDLGASFGGDHAGPAQYPDPRRARPLQGARAGAGGGAAGEDVVDQQDLAAAHRPLPRLAHREGAAHRLRPLAPAEALERRRRAGADQQIERERTAGRARQRTGDQGGLVVAPLPDPPAVERHRHEQGLRVRLQPAAHEAREGLGHSGPAAIFELEGDGAGDLAISDGGAQAVERRRLGEAAAALRLRAGAERERQAATGAAGVGEELELRPAVEAEIARFRDDRPAGGATRRQREIDRRGGDAAKGDGGAHLAPILARSAGRFKRAPPPRGSDAAHQVQDEDDQQDEAEAARGEIAPAAAIAPGRERTDQEDDEDYEQDEGHL